MISYEKRTTGSNSGQGKNLVSHHHFQGRSQLERVGLLTKVSYGRKVVVSVSLLKYSSYNQTIHAKSMPTVFYSFYGAVNVHTPSSFGETLGKPTFLPKSQR